jgi:hypothetical protein
MPRPTPDIVDAASRCFHFNMSMLIPDYIVIRSPQRKTFAVTTIGLFHLNRAANKSDDWQIAINLASEDIMDLMGIIPQKPPEPFCDDSNVFAPPPPDPPSEIRGVADHASGA